MGTPTVLIARAARTRSNRVNALRFIWNEGALAIWEYKLKCPLERTHASPFESRLAKAVTIQGNTHLYFIAIWNVSTSQPQGKLVRPILFPDMKFLAGA